MSGHLSLVRDRDTGRVFADPVDGRCRIAYTPSAFDKVHAMEGLLACARIAYVAGAHEIFLGHAGVRPFVRNSVPQDQNEERDTAEKEEESINDVRFKAWLDEIKKRGLPSPETSWGSAHQMGTCRMSDSAGKGVVDPNGKAWGVEGLYIADASIFPSASGVNPMVTIMAISDWISRRIAKGLNDGRGRGN